MCFLPYIISRIGWAGQPLPSDRHFFAIHVLQIGSNGLVSLFVLLKVWWLCQITIAMLGSPQG